MKLILKKVHVYLYVFSVALTYFLLWPFFYFLSLKPSRYRALNGLRRIWAFISSGIVGFFYKFEYEVPIDWSKTYIVCPNHSSNLDIAAMCVLVNNNCSFMGKEALKDGLVTSIFFRSVDIPVNRESKMSSYRAFKEATERLKNGTTLVIFPEGGISDNYPPVLQQFKNGPFKMAIEFKIPIIPVSSSNTWEKLWDDGTKYGTHPGICNFYVHKPVETSHLTLDDGDALRDKVFDIIGQKLGSPAVAAAIA
jgi:1-acyl-sn-glycerol-3-phosphate acyltransferase